MNIDFLHVILVCVCDSTNSCCDDFSRFAINSIYKYIFVTRKKLVIMHFSLALTLVVLVSLHSCSAYMQHLRKHRKCIHIRKCEPVMKLLSNDVVKSIIYGEVNKAICGFEANEPKIFCDIDRIIPNHEYLEAYFFPSSVIPQHLRYPTTSTSTTAAPIETTTRSRLEYSKNADLQYLRRHGKCVHILKCKPIVTLLVRPIVKSRTYNRIRDTICGFEGVEPRIYCDAQQITPDSESSENSEPAWNSKSESMPSEITSIIDEDLSEYFEDFKRHGDCMRIAQCKPVLRLMIEPITKSTIHNHVRDMICGFEGIEPKIYCDAQKSSFNINLNSLSAKSRSRNPKLPESTTTARSITQSYTWAIEDHPNFNLLEHKICGPISVQSRIQGGDEAKIGEFPWMALLTYKTSVNGSVKGFHCGATIVNRNHVMTAAHCVTNLPRSYKSIGVRVGEYNLAKEQDCEIDDNGIEFNCSEKYQDLGVEEIFVHPEYEVDTLRNDIALIRLKGTLNFNKTTVRPICLPIDRIIKFTGKTGIVTGWGSTAYGSPTSDILLKVSLPIVPQETCSKAYRDQPIVKLWYKQICAGGVSLKDSCKGDSGGPLHMVDRYKGEQRTVQYGIVSFGRTGCGLEGFPGVYTSVVHYVKWILDKLDESNVRMEDSMTVY